MYMYVTWTTVANCYCSFDWFMHYYTYLCHSLALCSYNCTCMCSYVHVNVRLLYRDLLNLLITMILSILWHIMQVMWQLENHLCHSLQHTFVWYFTVSMVLDCSLAAAAFFACSYKLIHTIIILVFVCHYNSSVCLNPCYLYCLTCQWRQY